MDIRGLGEANIQKFYEMGFLKSLPGVYTLDYEKIGALEGFGKKSIDNLKAAVESSKKQPLHRLIFALGIRFIGETTAKVLAHAVNHLLELQQFSQEQLMELEDIGPKVAGSVYTFFQNDDNIRTLQELETLGLNLANDRRSSSTSGNLEGVSFLFTGTMTQLKRSEAEERVEVQGGTIASGVSSKLNYLVVGEDAGSKLEKAKKISSIKIISESEFLKLVSAG
jgi:DNA ligase (NAD+)